jgi:hypothetical protein
MVRVLQAMQDTRTAFRLYLVENGLNIVFGVALVGPLGVRGLALSLTIAYSVAAVLALAVVRHRVGGLGGDDLVTPVKRVLLASAVMGVVTVLAVNVSGATSGPALLGRVVLAVVVGVLAYGATAALLGARHARRTIELRAERAAGRAAASRPDTARRYSSSDPFRDRLGADPADLPRRHLRPVGDQPRSDADPGDDRSGPDEEDEFDDPNPGGDR